MNQLISETVNEETMGRPLIHLDDFSAAAGGGCRSDCGLVDGFG